MTILNVHQTIDINHVLLDYLPFHHFYCRFDQAGMLGLKLSIHLITVIFVSYKKAEPY